ncbi:uncharacterized protein PODANS_6_1710 [Podospora anserina S mat+]|uniref:Podospora anserina S mat+ genomic DNA chromosome 6, supercontig 2 n=1 Tax=Podospora anserina (strain S / ATCC MYA-4624 / DSM 980 / FGSC 10383) TaxID=515849 RepID=B2B2Y3_PODAN|nr:uncharacterized protein PODANS_6_1710 [Podospora anserina S mat+]CAP71469.1 unnamed protein product [Podospora anserina S mat+]CDP30866.1 Putative protein of unknown function [Podospora anserina S mat+]
MGPSGALSSLPKLMASVGSWVESVKSSPPLPLSPPPTSEYGDRYEEDSRLQECIEEDIKQSIERDDDGDVDMTDSEGSTPPSSDPRTPESRHHLRGGYPKHRQPSFGQYSPTSRLAMIQEDEPLEIHEDGYDTNSDWDDYGTISQIIGDYEEGVSRLEGYDDWNEDQKKVHKLIYLRGLHPMIPSNWKICFKMWGINQPHLDDVFTPSDCEKRVVIHAYKGIHAAGKALENLFYLSQHVTDYEELGLQDKASGLIVKAIKSYIKWSMQDASMTPRKELSIVLVHDYTARLLNMPISRDNSMGVDHDSFAYDSDEEGSSYDREIEDAMSRSIERRLRALGKRWREVLARGNRFVSKPPTLYQFSVIQHMVMLSSFDPSSSKNPIVILHQVPMNDRGQWLWNALSIAIPVHLAREAMIDLLNVEGVMAELSESDDPDL